MIYEFDVAGFCKPVFPLWSVPLEWNCGKLIAVLKGCVNETRVETCYLSGASES